MGLMTITVTSKKKVIANACGVVNLTYTRVTKRITALSLCSTKGIVKR